MERMPTMAPVAENPKHEQPSVPKIEQKPVISELVAEKDELLSNECFGSKVI